MEHIETVYQAIVQVNQSVTGQLTKAYPSDVTEITQLSYEQVFIALKQLYADDRITANIVPSTGKNDYGEPLGFKEIVAVRGD